MFSSGTTALSTSSASVSVAIAASNDTYRTVDVINAGSGAGFISFDKETSWHYFPVGSRTFAFIDGQSNSNGIRIKRAGATDLSSVYISAYN